MGKRNRSASVAKVMAAFFERRTWTQADLARTVGLSREAVVVVLHDLQESGIPLQSEPDHPHVYWRMPRDWYPGGVLFRAEYVPDLLRYLSRLPASKGRNQLLAIVVSQLPGQGKLTPSVPLIARTASEADEQYLTIVEDAAGKRVALRMQYFTTSRRDIGDRHVSIHSVDVGPPGRFIATCHRTGQLKWFRVDGIVRARLDGQESYRGRADEDVRAFHGASLDGYKGDGAALECSFFVREPESTWVARNLLDGMRPESLPGGVRVHTTTSAILRLARFVVSLGGAARPETGALAEAVAALARGALDQAQRLVANPMASADSAGGP
jgi:predicted DNA-binding transcriptional regulator YafY